MKKTVKIFLCIAIVSIVIGTGLMIAGVIMGAPMRFGYENGKLVPYSDKNNYKLDMTELEKFDKIEIDTDTVDVNIIEGDYFGISYNVYSYGENKPKYSVDDGVLSVKYKGTHGIISFDFGSLMNNDKNEGITIYVPKNQTLNNIRVNSDIGKTIIENISTNGINAESDTGDVEITNVNSCDNLKVDVSTGEIRLISVEANNIDASNDTGDVICQNIKTDNINAKTDTGDINIYIVGNKEDYSYDIENDIGEIEIEGDEKGDSYKESFGDKSITAKNDIGDVIIDFK